MTTQKSVVAQLLLKRRPANLLPNDSYNENEEYLEDKAIDLSKKTMGSCGATTVVWPSIVTRNFSAENIKHSAYCALDCCKSKIVLTDDQSNSDKFRNTKGPKSSLESLLTSYYEPTFDPANSSSDGLSLRDLLQKKNIKTSEECLSTLETIPKRSVEIESPSTVNSNKARNASQDKTSTNFKRIEIKEEGNPFVTTTVESYSYNTLNDGISKDEVTGDKNSPTYESDIENGISRKTKPETAWRDMAHDDAIIGSFETIKVKPIDGYLTYNDGIESTSRPTVVHHNQHRKKRDLKTGEKHQYEKRFKEQTSTKRCSKQSQSINSNYILLPTSAISSYNSNYNLSIGIQCNLLPSAQNTLQPTPHQSSSNSERKNNKRNSSNCDQNESDHKQYINCLRINASNATEIKLKCEHCDITFGDEVLHSIHMGCHSVGDAFVCNVCGVYCSDKYNFYTHIMRGHHYNS